MVDVFEEVEEQLRSARYQTIIRKGWPYALAAVVIAIVVTGGVWAVRQHGLDEAAKASLAYQQGLDALGGRNLAAAEKSFAEVARSGPPAYKALALMQQAGLRTRDRKTAEAVALLDEAAKAAKDPLVGDAARLKAAYLVFDTASLADLEARLTPLTQTGHPYVALAREALAMKRLTGGDTAAARQALSLLAISPESGDGLQARAQVGQAVIDAGQASALNAIARAAAALPPSAATPPPAPPQTGPSQTDPSQSAPPASPQSGAPQ